MAVCTAARSLQTISTACTPAGITNLNVDLIAGLAGQTLATWNESLQVLIESDVPHASVYMLEVDEDSRLGREMLAGGARYHAELVPSDETIARMYTIAIEQLASAGLEQYEISNFSRPGFDSRHNLRYWQRRPYLGMGLDASYVESNAGQCDTTDLPYVLRSTMTDDLNAFLAGANDRKLHGCLPPASMRKRGFSAFALSPGLVAELEREFGARLPPRSGLPRLEQDGLLTLRRGRVRLTPRGRLLSNEVFQEFLGLEAATQSEPAKSKYFKFIKVSHAFKLPPTHSLTRRFCSNVALDGGNMWNSPFRRATFRHFQFLPTWNCYENARCFSRSLFCVMSGTLAFPQTQHALLIGINTYQPTGTTAQHPAGCIYGRCEMGSFENLDGAVNDAQAMADLLTSPNLVSRPAR